MSDATRIAVGSGPASYDVVVGSGLDPELPGVLGRSVRQVLVVHPAALDGAGRRVRDLLVHNGFQAHLAVVPAFECGLKSSTSTPRVQQAVRVPRAGSAGSGVLDGHRARRLHQGGGLTGDAG